MVEDFCGFIGNMVPLVDVLLVSVKCAAALAVLRVAYRRCLYTVNDGKAVIVYDVVRRVPQKFLLDTDQRRTSLFLLPWFLTVTRAVALPRVMFSRNPGLPVSVSADAVATRTGMCDVELKITFFVAQSDINRFLTIFGNNVSPLLIGASTSAAVRSFSMGLSAQTLHNIATGRSADDATTESAARQLTEHVKSQVYVECAVIVTDVQLSSITRSSSDSMSQGGSGSNSLPLINSPGR